MKCRGQSLCRAMTRARFCRSLVIVGLAVGGGAWALPAHGAPEASGDEAPVEAGPTAADKETARNLVALGDQEFETGDFEGALGFPLEVLDLEVLDIAVEETCEQHHRHRRDQRARDHGQRQADSQQTRRQTIPAEEPAKVDARGVGGQHQDQCKLGQDPDEGWF